MSQLSVSLLFAVSWLAIASHDRVIDMTRQRGWWNIIISRWWQLKYFLIFHPETWGGWTQFDEHVFQMGWWKTTNQGAVVGPKLAINHPLLKPNWWKFQVKICWVKFLTSNCRKKSDSLKGNAWNWNEASEFTPENGWLKDEISVWDVLFSGARMLVLGSVRRCNAVKNCIVISIHHLISIHDWTFPQVDHLRDGLQFWKIPMMDNAVILIIWKQMLVLLRMNILDLSTLTNCSFL